MRGETLKFA